ncbi:MAG TPA: hypothetical protein VGE38_08635 [Nocardioides sp.]|uniref:hypothetical protein n=1 Tax=Nocardioides sp. TaxID=35761 RepID=UPI002EDAEB17
MSIQHQVSNHRLPAWTRVAIYALDHDGHHLKQGDLRRAIDPHQTMRPTDVWRAVRQAIDRRLLDPASTTRRLVLARPATQQAEQETA